MVGLTTPAVFLSASVPVSGRGSYYETADPFLIQVAVREFVTAVLGRFRIVSGGHPAITPMILAICQDLARSPGEWVELYQSAFFGGQFPEENAAFGHVTIVPAVAGDRETSLFELRKAMLSRTDLVAAVFIGGMEGIEAEYALFEQYHPEALVLPIPSPGGAARVLAERLGLPPHAASDDVDFARIFRNAFPSGSKGLDRR
jgi:hypothetical protein